MIHTLVEFLSYPFVQRALVAGIVAGGTLSILGIFVVLRRMAFLSDGIAHASLAGVAVGVLLSQEPLYFAIGVSVLFAILIYFLERKTTLAPDTLIGILFTASLALGVMLMQLKRGYQPDLIGFLFGNILTIRTEDLVVMIVLSAGIITLLLTKYRKYLFLSLNAELAQIAGIRVSAYQFVLYIALAVAVVLGVKLLGVILVSALLIIPVSTSKLFTRSAGSLLIASVIIAELSVVTGMVISLVWNVPTGSTIVLVGTAGFFLATVVRLLRTK